MLEIKWEAVAGATVLVLGVVFKFALDWQKARREAASADERLQVLRDIAMSNQAIRQGQIAQNGKLSEIVAVNGARHDDIIRALNSTCKAKPIFPPREEQRQQQRKHL